MIEYYTSKGFFKVKHVLFSDKVNLLDFYKFANYSYIRKNLSNPLFIKTRRQTIATDLTQDIENIFQEFGKNNRWKIRRAIKENLEFGLVNDLNEFINFYNDFAVKKDLSLINYIQLAKIPKLIVTKVVQRNVTIAMHSYILDNQLRIARLLHSASIRFEQNINQKIVGWANRYLHFEDMKYFKNQEIKTYDMGGTAEHTKKIVSHHLDEFKKEFGGRVVDEYVYESILLYLALKLKAIFSHNYPY